MTAAAYATNLTTFWLEGAANAIVSIGTGGAGTPDPETDFFIQGTDCQSKGAWANAIKGFILDNDGNANITVPTDGAIIFYAKYDAQGSLDTQANGGFQCVHGNTSSAYDHLYIGGKNTIAFNSWVPYVIDPGTATADTTTGGGASGTHRWVGILANLPTTSGPTKGNPIAMDAVRYGRCDVEYTLGDVTPNGPATFDGAEAVGNVVGTRWGLIELLDGAFQIQGFHSIGLSGTAVDFRDSDKVMFWRKQELNLTNDAISTAFNRVEIIHTSTICQWTNIIWSALGTRSRGTFVHTAGTCDLDKCQFYDWNTFTFLAAANITDTIFSRCNPVTAPGSVMTGSQIIAPTVSADGSGFVYDAAVEPDGKLDNMIFEMGSVDHHAIDFGTNFDSSLTSVTLRGCEFNGFGAVDDANASTLRFLATTGSLTLNLIDCLVDGVSPVASGGGQNFSVDDAAGMTVTVVVAPVTLQITVTDKADLQPIENVQTSIYLADSPFTELMNEDTTASGIASESYSGSTPVDIKWRTRKSDELDDPRYFAQSGLGEITTDGFTLSVLMEENTIFPEPEAPPGTFQVLQSGYNNNVLTGSSLTVSPTLTAGNTRKLLVWGGYEAVGDTTMTATYDGNAMTSINNARYGLGNGEQELFWYDIPDVDSGSKDIVVTYGATPGNRSVMFAIIELGATGAEEDDTTDSITTAKTATSSMTSTSTDTIFIHGALIDSGSGTISASSGASEELNQAFDSNSGHIAYEIRTASGADTITSIWQNNSNAVSNGCVIAKA